MTKYDLVPCELSAPQCLDDLLPRLTFGPGAVAEGSKSNTLSFCERFRLRIDAIFHLFCCKGCANEDLTIHNPTHRKLENNS